MRRQDGSIDVGGAAGSLLVRALCIKRILRTLPWITAITLPSDLWETHTTRTTPLNATTRSIHHARFARHARGLPSVETCMVLWELPMPNRPNMVREPTHLQMAADCGWPSQCDKGLGLVCFKHGSSGSAFPCSVIRTFSFYEILHSLQWLHLKASSRHRSLTRSRS